MIRRLLHRDRNCDGCRAGVPPAHQSPRRSASRRTPVQRRSRLPREMVPGLSNQLLCNLDLTKVRVPEIRSRDPEGSRLPNRYLAEVRGKQRVSQPVHDTRKAAIPSGCRVRHCAGTTTRLRARAPHNGATGLPREARCGLALPATRQAAGAPSAWSQPPHSPTRDHADGATLGRRDANGHGDPEGRG